MSAKVAAEGEGVLNEARVAFAGAWATRFAPAMTSRWHAQHAAALLVGLDVDVSVETPEGTLQGRALLVAPDRLHRARCPGPSLAVLFDPEAIGARGRWPVGAARLEGEPGQRLGEALRAHRAVLDRPDVGLGLAAEFARSLCLGSPPRRDRRVDAALTLLGGADLSVEACARSLALSPAHLRALFAREVGVSPKRYRLWSRLVRALREAAAGRRRATHARTAADAGFADAAHFCRAASTLLGYAPSALVGSTAR